jgi:hypothetical protein
VRELVQATLDLARGLALAGLLTDDTRRRKHVASAWAGILDASLHRPTHQEDPPDSQNTETGDA